MFDKYLVTGATGFLGRAVAEELVRRKAQVHALVLHDDPCINLLPKEVHTVIGDVCDKGSLSDFFADADSRTCVIHCAGIVSVASRPGPRLYHFVDVRDVANGILACSESGEPGKGYILSGCYVTIRRMLQLVGKAAKLKYRPICLPLGLARLAAPYYERRSLRERKPLFFTPYSVSVLASNGQFSHAAASECFAYQPRPMEETLGDMTAWLLEQRRKDEV